MKKKTVIRRLLNNFSFPISAILESRSIDSVDIVVVTSPPLFTVLAGMQISRRKNAKLVLDVRDVWPETALNMGGFTKSSIYYHVFRKIADEAYRRADLITTVTPGTVKVIASAISKMAAFDTDKIKLIRNGFDKSLFLVPDNIWLKNKLSSGGHFSCAYIGNLGIAQGLQTLIELAEDCQINEVPIKFHIFGKGAEEGELREQANQKNLSNITFYGHIPLSDIATVYSNIDFSYVALKSSRMKDSIPTKLYESLSFGCPVLLVASGDACSLLEESGLGCSAPPEDRKEIFSCLKKMIGSGKDYEKKKEIVRRNIQKEYSRESAACAFEEELLKLFKEGEQERS